MNTWNPHIIDPHPRSWPSRVLSDARDRVKKVQEKAAEIQESHAKAKKLLQKYDKNPPLALSLVPKTKRAKDTFEVANKLGGVPYLREQYRLIHRNDPRLNYKETVEQYVENHWPRCPCCADYMLFLGQFEFTEWLAAIQLLTAENEWSAMGHDYDNLKIGTQDIYWSIYSCPYSRQHNFNPNYDSVIVVDQIYTAEAKAEQKKYGLADRIVPVEEVVPALQKFMKNNVKWEESGGTIEPFASQLITGFDLLWQLDYMKRPETENEIDEITRKNKKIFTNEYMKLFGAPRSQQDAKRFWSRGMGWSPKHQAQRMPPVFAWEGDHDETYQLYGDFTIYEPEGRKRFWCKMDASCT